MTNWMLHLFGSRVLLRVSWKQISGTVAEKTEAPTGKSEFRVGVVSAVTFYC